MRLMKSFFKWVLWTHFFVESLAYSLVLALTARLLVAIFLILRNDKFICNLKSSIITLGSGLAPSNQTVTPYWKPLESEDGKDNDLSIALITYLYILENTFFGVGGVA